MSAAEELERLRDEAQWRYEASLAERYFYAAAIYRAAALLAQAMEEGK